MLVVSWPLLLGAGFSALLKPCRRSRPERGGGKRNRCGLGAGARAKRGATAVSISLGGEGRGRAPSLPGMRPAGREETASWDGSRRPKPPLAGSVHDSPAALPCARDANQSKHAIALFILPLCPRDVLSWAQERKAIHGKRQGA